MFFLMVAGSGPKFLLVKEPAFFGFDRIAMFFSVQ